MVAEKSELKPKAESKSSKEAPFSKFQAGVLFVLLLIAGLFILLHTHKTTTTNNGDAWVEIMDEYGCKHHNDIPENLSDGSGGGCVKFAQFLLEVGSNSFHVLGNDYDAKTKAQVIDFQQRNGLPTTGGVDEHTWTKLESCVNTAASGTGGVWKCQQIKTY